MAREVFRRMCPRIWKQYLMNELDRRRRPFDVEEKRANPESGKADSHNPPAFAVAQATEGGHYVRAEGRGTSWTNAGPKHTGWKAASTRLFV